MKTISEDLKNQSRDLINDEGTPGATRVLSKSEYSSYESEWPSHFDFHGRESGDIIEPVQFIRRDPGNTNNGSTAFASS